MSEGEIRTSVEVASLFEAFAAASAEIENIKQNRDVEVRMKSGGKYSYSYATLAQILHDVRAPLTGNGMWYTQYVRDGEMVTRLLHKSGQWMETGMIPMPNVTGAPADIGGVVSFFKRYSLSAALGLATEDDSAGEDEHRGEVVEFKPRGVARDAPPPEPQVEIPPGGFGDWARDLMMKVNDALKDIATEKPEETVAKVDALKNENKRYINSVKKVDSMIFADIEKTFKDAYDIARDELPF